MILGLLLGGGIGLALGLLGGGGSILAVPIFVYVLGYGAKEAIAMSLAVVGATSLVGAARHWKLGNVDVRTALAFGVVAMAATYLGARLAVFVSGAFQLTLFAVVMAIAALFMFGGRSGRRLNPESSAGWTASARRARLRRWLLIGTEGAAVGILTGLVGVGGGFLIVPALVLLGRVPMKRAGAMKSGAGFAGYLGQVEVPWLFLAAFTAPAVAGILGGASLVRLVPQDALRRAFAIFLLLTSALILYENRTALGFASSERPLSPSVPPLVELAAGDHRGAHGRDQEPLTAVQRHGPEDALQRRPI